MLFPVIFSIAVFVIALCDPPPLYNIYKLVDPRGYRSHDPFMLAPYNMKKPDLSFVNWVFFCFHYVLVMLCGNTLFRNFLSTWAPNSQPARLICSFFTGYLVTIGFARLAGLFVFGSTLYWITISFLCVMAIGTAREIRYKEIHFKLDSKLILWMACALFFVIAALLLQVYQCDFSWHSHFGMPYSKIQRIMFTASVSYVPLFFSYYDSVLFHYVITFPFAAKIYEILPWWITLGMVKLSLFVFLYGIFRKLNLTTLLALASTLFIFFGTVSPVITRYYLLFDYGNPIFQESDISRIVGFAAFMLVAISVADGNTGIKWPGIILFSLGTASLVPSHTAWIIVAWLVIWFFPMDNEKIVPCRILDSIICYSAIFAWLLLFSLPFSGYYITRLILCFIPVIVWIVRYFYAGNRINLTYSKEKALSVLAIISICIGLLFMGNIFVNNPVAIRLYGLFNHPFDIIGIENASAVSRGDYSLGDFRDFFRMALHAQFTSGPVAFLCFYGGILIMILFCQYWTQQSFKVSPPERISRILHEFFLIVVISLPLLFFFMNFINIGEHAWYKIRFTQIPILYIQFYFFYVLSRCEFMCRKHLRTIALAVVLLLCLLPFIATQRPAQILENLKVIQAVFLN